MRFLNLCLLINLFYQFGYSQTSGCTDPLATNYNANATINDGSCIYNASSISPLSSFSMQSVLNETSGLIRWGNFLFTHNDNTDKRVFALDTLNGLITNTYTFQTLTNIDWEEITQDSLFVYIGDFGNNANGNRTNLKIYKINKASILTNSPVIDTIKFNYSNQSNFTATGSNNTDFDCEAFIVTNDSIYLFTKQWVTKKTSLYSLPKTGGTHVANFKSTLDVAGLITGSTFVKNKKIVTLCGYSNTLQPFFYLLYDFNGNSFFSGNKRKVSINLPFHQIEGIATSNGIKFYLSNEYFFNQALGTYPQKLTIFDLSTYLGNYINTVTNLNQQISEDIKIAVYPTLIENSVVIEQSELQSDLNYKLTDQFGKIICIGKCKELKTTILLSELSKGIYILTTHGNFSKSFRLIKK